MMKLLSTAGGMGMDDDFDFGGDRRRAESKPGRWQHAKASSKQLRGSDHIQHSGLSRLRARSFCPES